MYDKLSNREENLASQIGDIAIKIHKNPEPGRSVIKLLKTYEHKGKRSA